MKQEDTTGEKLHILRTGRDLTQDEVAEATGISKASICNYETKEKDISHVNLMKLAQFYEVSSDYLLGLKNAKNHLNTEEKSLDLSDKVVNMLFLKKINVRLLCELMEHPLFPLLLTDLEVFVDGYVTMQLHNLNLPLEQAQKMVGEKYQVADDELYMRTLELAKIRENSYFSGILHSDLMEIIKDIRSKHENDTLSAPNENIAEKNKTFLQDNLEQTLNKGTPTSGTDTLELAESMGMNCEALTEEERGVFVELLKKVTVKPARVMSRRERRGMKRVR
ncbi:MAG: helix-turn-helix transcriptional regulator [Eubacteriales bacterium]